ncbi:Wadjet anti-phage system protein JetD domain-containing protein [Piscibacillus sp. B03]|uniref:Wadjet anti-phage system protein JetD domain-containing protein n=1 Tax=Piscibacillus sp. B03 TaxID=3457430 RepID=UPI003FCC7D9C
MIEQVTRELLDQLRPQKSKKKIDMIELEKSVRTRVPDYYGMGGYQAFYDVMMSMQHDEVLVPLKSKAENGKSPALPRFFWLMPPVHEPQWTGVQKMQVQDLLNLSFYDQNPEFQSEQEWNRILNIYHFLKNKHNREYVSVAERSLELFGDEKAVTKEKRGILNRLKLSLDDIKAVSYGEPFVYYLKPGTDINQVKRVLIVENLSFFHTGVTLLNRNELDYQMLIYGEGKKIESSFQFYYDHFPGQAFQFYYVGDLDPEGYNIFARLVNRYEHEDFQLALEIYQQMLRFKRLANDVKGQNENERLRDRFLEFVTGDLRTHIIDLWERHERIPQEVITVESWQVSDCD